MGSATYAEWLNEAAWPYGNGLREMYRFYRDSLAPGEKALPYDKFMEVLKAHNGLLVEDMLEGRLAGLPASMGYMCVQRKRQANRPYLAVDREATERARAEARAAGEDDCFEVTRIMPEWLWGFVWHCPRCKQGGQYNVPYKFFPLGRIRERLRALVDGRAGDDPLADGFTTDRFIEKVDYYAMQEGHKRRFNEGRKLTGTQWKRMRMRRYKREMAKAGMEKAKKDVR